MSEDKPRQPPSQAPADDAPVSFEPACARLDALLARGTPLSGAEVNELRDLLRPGPEPPPPLGPDLESAFAFVASWVHYGRSLPRNRLTPRARRMLLVVVPAALIGGVLFVGIDDSGTYGIVAIGLVVAVVIALEGTLHRYVYARAYARAASRCPGCGYSLDGLPEAFTFEPDVTSPPKTGPARCPECGQVWPAVC